MAATTRKATMEEEAPQETPEDTPTDEVVAEDVEAAPEDEEEEEWDSTKMDPNEELWDGGPTFGTINGWKEQYGDVFVTAVTAEKFIVWRTLTRFEYRRLVKNLEEGLSTGQVSQAEANMNNEDAIAELCILFPPYSRVNSSSELAGLASTITAQVMEASAFSAVEVRQL